MFKSAIMLALATGLCSAVFAKEGAKVQPVDKKGNPVGNPVSLPDCRSCKVEKTGPSAYTVTIPKEQQRKLDQKVEDAQRK